MNVQGINFQTNTRIRLNIGYLLKFGVCKLKIKFNSAIISNLTINAKAFQLKRQSAFCRRL
jgi:hypothetical protein